MLNTKDGEFVLNLKTVPNVPFTEFRDLAASLSYVEVEPRTDLGWPIVDGRSASDAEQMVRSLELHLIGLSEVCLRDD